LKLTTENHAESASNSKIENHAESALVPKPENQADQRQFQN
jgi:hypothetical protein